MFGEFRILLTRVILTHSHEAGARTLHGFQLCKAFVVSNDQSAVAIISFELIVIT